MQITHQHPHQGDTDLRGQTLAALYRACVTALWREQRPDGWAYRSPPPSISVRGR